MFAVCCCLMEKRFGDGSCSLIGGILPGFKAVRYLLHFKVSFLRLTQTQTFLEFTSEKF